MDINDKTFDITIAVLTRNNEKTIRQCIDAILLNYKHFFRVELLVLDNGSTDSTLEIVRNYGIEPKHLPSLNIPQLRNMAGRNAKSEIIGFVDSDCIIGCNWISRALKILEEPNVSITGYRYSMLENSTWLQTSWYSNNKKERRDDQLIPGGNIIVKKKSFWSIGGFNEKLKTGEDADFLERARMSGHGIVSDPELVNFHLGFPENLIDFYRKEKWYGKGTQIHNLLKGHDKPTLGAITFFLCVFVSLIGSLFLNYWVAITGFGLALCTCLAAAMHRKYVNGVGRGLMSMTFIYIVYFIARINSLIESLFNDSFKKKQNKIPVL